MLLKKTLIESRARQLPIGNHYLRLKSVLPNDINSTVTNYYQIGKNTLRLMCLLELFEHIISEPLFDILRTQEQLGELSIKGNNIINETTEIF